MLIDAYEVDIHRDFTDEERETGGAVYYLDESIVYPGRYATSRSWVKPCGERSFRSWFRGAWGNPRPCRSVTFYRFRKVQP